MDFEGKAPEKFKAAQPQLFSLIIKGILGGTLEWTLIIAGALIAVALELLGVSSLAVAVGMYLGLDNATPIFIGGMLRWATDRMRGGTASEAETETSPGVLLSSGYIAGGTLCGLVFAFVSMAGATKVLDLSGYFGEGYEESAAAKLIAVGVFLAMAVILFIVGSKKSPELEGHEPTGNGQNANH